MKENNSEHFEQIRLADHKSIHKNDLTSKLIKCGHILMHKTGKNRGQEKILEILYQHHYMSQKQLQEILGIEAGSLSEILSKLERNGFIRKERDRNDKRKLIIVISEKGIHKVKNKKDNNENMFDMLSQEEQEQLNVILDKVLEEWHKRHMKYHHKK